MLFGKKTPPPDATYLALRQQALAVDPLALGVRLDNAQQVYCAVADLSVGEGSTTLVCTIDGAVSLYHSTGSGSIGLGQRSPAVAQAGCSLLVSAGQTLPFFPTVEQFPLPARGQTFVYLKAGDGVHRAEYRMDRLSQAPRHLQFLNFLVQNTLNQIRQNSPPQ